MRGSWQLYEDAERWRRPARDGLDRLAGNGAEAVNFGARRSGIGREASCAVTRASHGSAPDLLADDFRSGGGHRSHANDRS